MIILTENALRKIIFDIDDILWPLNNRVSKLTKIDANKLITYNPKDNPLLSDNEKQMLINTYNRADLFEDIKFSPGIEKINDLNADVYINSNAYSQKAIDLKKSQLQKILNIPEDHYIFNLITPETSKKPKIIDSDIFIFVDDSPYNIINSNAQNNIMIKKPYNTSQQAFDLYAKHPDKKIIICENLNNVIRIINDLLNNKYRKDPYHDK